MIDGNTAALAKYEREQQEQEEKWEKATAYLEKQYGQVLDEMFSAIQTTADDTGFDFQDLLDDLMGENR